MKSKLELRFVMLLRYLGSDLPGAEREYIFAAPRKFRFDFAFPKYKIAVEIDGGQWAPGGGRHAKDADREKMNLAALHGWTVLHFSGDMLKDGHNAIQQVRLALQAKGVPHATQ